MDIINDHDSAFAACGGLSKTSKMPCYSYSIPATQCATGSILREIPDSTCSKCYACKGHYAFGAAKNAMQRRFDTLRSPNWVAGIVYLIMESDHHHFRWHDSGDLQGDWHLDNIIEVALWLPEIRFWLPTREAKLVALHKTPIPPNLIIRVSDAMIDGQPASRHALTSGVTRHIHEATCPARFNDNKCGICRACWDSTVPRIVYPLH